MDACSADNEQENMADRCRWFRVDWKWRKVESFNLGINLRLNPVVSFVSAFIIWGFVVWCLTEQTAAAEKMGEWKIWITQTFTWLYIGARDAWAVFIIGLYISKYGNMKLGKPDEKPEFKDASYFTILFAGQGIAFEVGMLNYTHSKHILGRVVQS